MKDEEEVLRHLKEDLKNLRNDWEEVQKKELLEQDVHALKKLADDIAQLGEDAKDAQEFIQYEHDALAIQHLLNTPWWGNISLLYAADQYDEHFPETTLFYDLIDEFKKHPEQYQKLFGSFEHLMRRINGYI